jgi:tetratricopeptide (TPR) repeat protein
VKRDTSKTALRFLTLVAALGALSGTLAARAQQDENGLDAIWNDPTFQRQFVAGYGVNAEIEPRVTPEEVEILDKVLPLMPTDKAKAESALKKLLKPDCSAVLDYTLGGIQFQQERLPEARATFERAVAKFPSFRRAWRCLGLVHVRTGDFDATIRAFTRWIELGGADAYAFGLLGFAHASKKDYQPAEAAYRNALLLQPDNAEWRLGLTRCVFYQGKFEDAASLLDVLIARYPDNADFWLLQAQTFANMKKPLRAAENYEVLDRLGKAKAENLHALGEIYVSENLMDLAARAFLRALAVEPDQPLARPLRAAELLLSRNAIPQARQITAKLDASGESMEEGERRKLLKLEARLSMAGGDGGTEMVGVLEEIIQLDPLDGEALMLLGQHYAGQNEPDKAILYFERASSLTAYEFNAKLNQAYVYMRMGRNADAVPLLRRAQELKPRDDLARLLESVERQAKARR